MSRKASIIIGMILTYAFVVTLGPVIYHYFSMPVGSAFSGYIDGDSVWCLWKMQSWNPEVYSAHKEYITFYSVDWIYLALGFLSHLTIQDNVTVFYLFSFICAAFYLYAACRVLKEFIPEQSNRAVIIFLWTSGLGGAIYLLWHFIGGGGSMFAKPGYPFFGLIKVITYDMFEGTGVTPYTQLSRIYYTLPLALGYLGLVYSKRWMENKNSLWPSLLLILFSCLTNARFGLTLTAVSALAMLVYGGRDIRRILKSVVLMGGAAFIGIIPMMLHVFMYSSLFSEYVKRSTVPANPVALAVSLGFLLPLVLYFILKNQPQFSGRITSAALKFFVVYNLVSLPILLGREAFLRLWMFLSLNKILPMDEERLAKIALIMAVVVGLFFAVRTYKRPAAEKPATDQDKAIMFFGIVFFAALALCYFTIELKGIRFMGFLWLPASALAALYLEKYKTKGLLAIMLLLTIPSFVFYNAWRCDSASAAVISRDAFTMAKQLNDLPPGKVLCDYDTGLFFGVHSSKKSYYSPYLAFFPGSNKALSNLEKMLDRHTPPEERQKLIEQNEIKYIVTGGNTMNAPHFNPANCAYLERLFACGAYEIYQVRASGGTSVPR